MAKKEALANSFGSTNRRKKSVLSDAEIDKIAEEREILKKTVVPTTEKPKAKPTPKEATKPAVKKTKAAPKAVQKKLKRVVLADDEEVIKTSLDMPISLYEDMKISLIRQKRSMREYLIDLIRKDLDKKKK